HEHRVGVEPHHALARAVAQPRDHAGDAIAAAEQQQRAAAGEQRRARGFGLWPHAVAHALLGAGRAAAGTGVGVAAAGCGARHLVEGPAHRLDAAREDARARRPGALGPAHAQLLLGPCEVRGETLLRGILEPVLRLPAQQDLARDAVPEAAVDLGAAADAAALDVAD